MLEILFWVFISSAGIQLLFLILVILVLSFYKKRTNSKVKIPGISVVISAKNEIENLKILIPNLLKQDYHNYEIILVDDRSTDETYEYTIALDHQEDKFKLVRIDDTPDHINNKKYALTLGI